MDELKFKLGTPEHGWLPVEISCGTYGLEFISSDVPVDPLTLLIEALSRVVNGIEGEVWWWLEPSGYFFVFDRNATKYSLKIIFADDDHERMDGTEEFTVTGSLEQIVLPFWRALQRFESHDHSEPAWPEFPQSMLQELTESLDQPGCSK